MFGRKWKIDGELEIYSEEKEVKELEVQLDKDTLYVCPQRDLDMAEAKTFRLEVDGQLFARSNIRRLVVDLSKVKFIDSSGLGALLGRYKLLQSRQGEMVLCEVDSRVYRILELSGMKKLMLIKQADEQKEKECKQW